MDLTKLDATLSAVADVVSEGSYSTIMGVRKPNYSTFDSMLTAMLDVATEYDAGSRSVGKQINALADLVADGAHAEEKGDKAGMKAAAQALAKQSQRTVELGMLADGLANLTKTILPSVAKAAVSVAAAGGQKYDQTSGAGGQKKSPAQRADTQVSGRALKQPSSAAARPVPARAAPNRPGASMPASSGSNPHLTPEL